MMADRTITLRYVTIPEEKFIRLHNAIIDASSALIAPQIDDNIDKAKEANTEALEISNEIALDHTLFGKTFTIRF